MTNNNNITMQSLARNENKIRQKYYNNFAGKNYRNRNTNKEGKLMIHDNLYKKLSEQRVKLEANLAKENVPNRKKLWNKSESTEKYLIKIIELNGEYDKLYKYFNKKKFHEQRVNNNINLSKRVFLNKETNIGKRTNMRDVFNTQNDLSERIFKLTSNGNRRGLRFFNHEYKFLFQSVLTKMQEFVKLLKTTPLTTKEIREAHNYISTNQKYLTRIIELTENYLKFQQMNKNLR